MHTTRACLQATLDAFTLCLVVSTSRSPDRQHIYNTTTNTTHTPQHDQVPHTAGRALPLTVVCLAAVGNSNTVTLAFTTTLSRHRFIHLTIHARRCSRPSWLALHGTPCRGMTVSTLVRRRAVPRRAVPCPALPAPRVPPPPPPSGRLAVPATYSPRPPPQHTVTLLKQHHHHKVTS